MGSTTTELSILLTEAEIVFNFQHISYAVYLARLLYWKPKMFSFFVQVSILLRSPVQIIIVLMSLVTKVSPNDIDE